MFCKACEPSKVLRMPAKTEVQPFALRVDSLARCNLEKRQNCALKSTRNRRKSRPGTARAPISVNFPPFRARSAPERRRTRPLRVHAATKTSERRSRGPAGSARRLPKDAPGRQKERPGVSGSAPRRPKSTPDRVREQQTRISCVQRGREALPEQVFAEFRKPRTLKK